LVPRLGLGRALGHRVPVATDVSGVAAIEQWPRSVLSDPAELEPRLAELGINAEFAPILPERLRRHAGDGIQFSQYPSQFSRYLAFVGERGVASYIEIGVDHGGTFLITTTYLNRLRTLERATAVDRFVVPNLRRFPGPALRTDVLRVDSTSSRFARYLDDCDPFDLALIDGDHSERGCRRDFERIREHARMIALHDIVGANTPGVCAVWQWLRREHADDYDFHEFCEQYPEVERARGERYLGIGLAVRKENLLPKSTSLV
jgi:hypothetical protein